MGRSLPSKALTLLVMLCLLLPFLASQISLLFSFDFSALNSLFFRIFFRSIGFGLTQALLSAVFACLLGSFFTFLLFSFFKGSRWALPLFKSSAALIFVLPGAAISLLTLNLFGPLAPELPALLLIVLSHSIWAGFLFGSQTHSKLLELWESGKLSQLETLARNSGLSPIRARLFCLQPTLKEMWKNWFALIMSWSLGSFSTVLILGNGPQHSTPEVLLYFTLVNDISPARLFLLALFNILIQLFIFRKVIWEKTPNSSTSSKMPALTSETGLKQLPHAIFPRSLFPIQILLALTPAALFLSFLSPLAMDALGSATLRWEEMLLASRNSLALALISCAFAYLYTLLYCAARSKALRLALWGFAISPVILSASWAQLGFSSHLWNRPLLSFAWVGFLISLLQVPLGALWIGREVQALRAQSLKVAYSLGMAPKESFRHFVWPATRRSRKLFLYFVFVFGIGELALSSYWLSEWPLLSTLARQFSQGYEFSQARLVLLFILLFTVLGYFAFVGNASKLRLPFWEGHGKAGSK